MASILIRSLINHKERYRNDTQKIRRKLIFLLKTENDESFYINYKHNVFGLDQWLEHMMAAVKDQWTIIDVLIVCCQVLWMIGCYCYLVQCYY